MDIYIHLSEASGMRTYIFNGRTSKVNPAVGIPFNGTPSGIASKVLKWNTNNNTSYCSNYYNANKSEEKEFTGTENGSYIAIGSFVPNQPNQLAKVNVYAVRVYNRALTDAEIEQNYNVDKSRFGF